MSSIVSPRTTIHDAHPTGSWHGPSMIGGASHQREQGEGRDRREEHRAPPKGDAMQAGRRAGKPPGGTVPVSELGWDGIGRWHVSAEPSKPWFVWPGRRRRSGSHRRPRPIIVRQRQQQRIGGSGATSLWSHGGRVEDDGGVCTEPEYAVEEGAVTTVWYSIVLHDSQSLVVEAAKYSRPTRRRLSTKSLVPRVDLTSKSRHLVVRRRLWRRQREAACAVVVGGWMKR